MGKSYIERVHAYEQAHNRHDIQAVMALCSDDIRFELAGVWVKVGKESVQRLAEWDAAINGSLILVDVAASDEGVCCRALERNDWFRLVGIREVEYTRCRFSFRRGLISEIRCEMASHSREAVSAALRSVVAWASAERAEVLARLVPGGEFLYGSDTASTWLALLHEWRQGRSHLS